MEGVEEVLKFGLSGTMCGCMSVKGLPRSDVSKLDLIKLSKSAETSEVKKSEPGKANLLSRVITKAKTTYSKQKATAANKTAKAAAMAVVDAYSRRKGGKDKEEIAEHLKEHRLLETAGAIIEYFKEKKERKEVQKAAVTAYQQKYLAQKAKEEAFIKSLSTSAIPIESTLSKIDRRYGDGPGKSPKISPEDKAKLEKELDIANEILSKFTGQSLSSTEKNEVNHLSARVQAAQFQLDKMGPNEVP